MMTWFISSPAGGVKPRFAVAKSSHAGDGEACCAGQVSPGTAVSLRTRGLRSASMLEESIWEVLLAVVDKSADEDERPTAGCTRDPN